MSQRPPSDKRRRRLSSAAGVTRPAPGAASQGMCRMRSATLWTCVCRFSGHRAFFAANRSGAMRSCLRPRGMPLYAPQRAVSVLAYEHRLAVLIFPGARMLKGNDE